MMNLDERLISQFASRVVNFSSQYGTNHSYSASNLAGPRIIMDRYGDFTEAFVLRTYGTWWKRCPSATCKLKKSASNFRSEDFVELEYECSVIPTSIAIYETYHPGSVVRILACNANENTTNTPGKVEWVTLWSGNPQCSQVSQEVRVFCPPLRKITFPTSLIRLEFNSEECEYYTELDAVELTGKKHRSNLSFKDRAEDFNVALTTRLLRQLSLKDRQTSITSISSQDDEDIDKWGYFAILPDELIQNILSFLDIISLSNVAQTCSLMLKNAYDPLLYVDLDLQSRWNTVDNVALESLVSRCSNLQHLNLSWTGGGGQITEQAVCRFLEECGKELTILRLACCQYISEKTIKTIASVCKHLEELDLQCTNINGTDLVHIKKLDNLKRLNLYSMEIDDLLLQTVGKCNKLEHLNIGASTITKSNYNLSKCLCQCLFNLKNLISLDLWRCKFADIETVRVIAENCSDLQELDIGWCSSIYGRYNSDFSVGILCSKCPKLKKLYLTCGRCVDDNDMRQIAKYCPDLEQIDILGTNRVHFEGVEAVCKACPKLFFFDISFCGGLDNDVVKELRQKYPRIEFKKSFQ